MISEQLSVVKNDHTQGNYNMTDRPTLPACMPVQMRVIESVRQTQTKLVLEEPQVISALTGDMERKLALM